MKWNQEMRHVERYLNSVLIVLYNSVPCGAEFLITANLSEVHHIPGQMFLFYLLIP
jgi:hypothetical protein